MKASRFLLKDDLEQTLSECVEDILREERVVEFGFVEGNVRLRVDDIIYIETSKHKNVFYTAGETYNGGVPKAELGAENLEALERGLGNGGDLGRSGGSHGRARRQSGRCRCAL